MIAASLYPPFSRNFDDEDEYADSSNSPSESSSALPPTLRWKQSIFGASNKRPRDAPPPLTVKTLVVGFRGGGASFAHKCFGLDDPEQTEWIGTLVLPGADKISTTGLRTTGSSACGGGDSLEAADPFNAACNVFRKKLTVGDAGGDVAVALCGYDVPPAAAHAWARVLLDSIAAEVVIGLAAVAFDPGQSAGWTGARLLATSQAEEREDCLEMSRGFLPLRTPAMVMGPAAALVSHCEREGRAAMCFATTEWPGLNQKATERAFDGTVKVLRLVAGDTVVMATAEKTQDDAEDDFVYRTGNLYV